MAEPTEAATPPETETPDEPTETTAVQVMDEAHPPVAPVAGTPAAFIAAAIQQGLPIETMERLFALYERQKADNARKAFFDAMARFRAVVPPIPKNKLVDFDTSKGRVCYRHATLDGIAEAIRKPLEEVGLSYRFETESNDAGLKVTCIVTHRDGHSESTSMTAPPDASGGKNVIQQLGSTLTYMRRYTLEGVFGLSTTEDTDGRKDGKGAPQPHVPDDSQWPPTPTEQTDEAASIRGPFGGVMIEVGDKRDAGKRGTRREFTVDGQPANYIFVTYSKLEKYKVDGKNEHKNAGPGRPFTCEVTEGKCVGNEVHFLTQSLRHPEASDAIKVDGFEWQDKPAAEPAPSPPEPERKVPQAATEQDVKDDPESQKLFDKLSAKGPGDDVEQAKQDVREAYAKVRAANVKEALINKIKRAVIGDGPWTACLKAEVLSEFAQQVEALAPPEKGDE